MKRSAMAAAIRARSTGCRSTIPTLETLFDYLPGASVSFDHMSDEAVQQRFQQVKEHYEARVDSLEGQRFGAPPYKPVPPDQMFLDGKAWGDALSKRAISRLTPFEDDLRRQCLCDEGQARPLIRR